MDLVPQGKLRAPSMFQANECILQGGDSEPGPSRSSYLLEQHVLLEIGFLFRGRICGPAVVQRKA